MLNLDPIASRSLYLLIGFFFIAGLCVFGYELLKKKVDPNLRKRYFSWYIIAPVMLVPAYFGGLPFAVLVTGLAIISLREFFSFAHVRDIRAYRWTGRIFSVLLVWTAIYNSTDIPAPFSWTLPWWHAHFGAEPLLGVPLFYLMPVFVIMFVLTIPVLLGKYEGMVMRESVTVFGILYFGWFLGHLILMRNLVNGFGYILFLAAAVVLNDVLAYTFGRLWGKTQLTPKISPKKTVEGAVGGVLGSLLAVIVFHYAVPALSWPAAIGAGLVVGAAAPLGDLVISVMKRDMSVKDSGNLIPGHGGLLDRCDSLIFAAPAFYYYLLLARHFPG